MPVTAMFPKGHMPPWIVSERSKTSTPPWGDRVPLYEHPFEEPEIVPAALTVRVVLKPLALVAATPLKVPAACNKLAGCS